MAASKRASNGASKKSGGGKDSPSTEASDDQVQAISEEASAVVRKAADVFETELSGGVAEARRLQKTFTERETLEPGDLDELAARVRRNAHQLIDAVSQRVNDLREDDVRDLTDRFTSDAHQVLDAFVDLADLAPRFVNSAMERVKSLKPEANEQDRDTDSSKKA
jgi:hypothetical protein